jgi:NAD(P)H-dependent FMN reductase
MENKTLILCGSIKPPNKSEDQSAARSIAKLVMRGLKDTGNSNYCYHDLRDMNLPFYDGRPSEGYLSEDLDLFKNNLLLADNIVVSVPCYWRSAAGGFVNLLNLFGGPLYDFPEGGKLLSNKNIFIIAVGANQEDANYGAEHIRNIFKALGANVMPNDHMIGNLRELDERDRKEISLSLYNLGKQLSIESSKAGLN